MVGLGAAAGVGGLRLLWFFLAGWSQALAADSILRGLSGAHKEVTDERVKRRVRRGGLGGWGERGVCSEPGSRQGLEFRVLGF